LNLLFIGWRRRREITNFCTWIGSRIFIKNL
jgi:hypothetical protein